MEDSPWGEHELDYAVVTRNMSLDRLQPNPSEVCDVKAVEEGELAEWVASGIFLSSSCKPNVQCRRRPLFQNRLHSHRGFFFFIDSDFCLSGGPISIELKNILST